LCLQRWVALYMILFFFFTRQQTGLPAFLVEFKPALLHSNSVIFRSFWFDCLVVGYHWICGLAFLSHLQHWNVYMAEKSFSTIQMCRRRLSLMTDRTLSSFGSFVWRLIGGTFFSKQEGGISFGCDLLARHIIPNNLQKRNNPTHRQFARLEQIYY
jgi:hypothetical protein